MRPESLGQKFSWAAGSSRSALLFRPALPLRRWGDVLRHRVQLILDLASVFRRFHPAI
jgi:hypothetical protein